MGRVPPRTVLLSRRANVFYLEHARVYQDGETVAFQVDTGEDVLQVFNIPDKNTVFLLLGRGTSITNAAMQKLSESNVIVGFSGSGGTPTYAVSDPVFVSPQSEYRPTEWMQLWGNFWWNEEKRMEVTRHLLRTRVSTTRRLWKNFGLDLDSDVEGKFLERIERGTCPNELMLSEAAWAKSLYSNLSRATEVAGFTREAGGEGQGTAVERVNSRLDHGNYLMYGYAAAALNSLGISFAFPLLHGKTRRGGLVFDVADIWKDGLVMPLAFLFEKAPKKGVSFRQKVINEARGNDLVNDTIVFLQKACETFGK